MADGLRMDRSTTFRSRLKEHDPGRYKEYLEKQRIRAKERREHLKKELQKKTPSPAAKQKKEHELQLQRERQRKWLAKKKAETMPSINIRKSVRKLCVETRHSKQHKREYNREKKREERANQSYQKKIQPTSPFSSKKTEWNITSQVRAVMPDTSEKFAKVIDNIEKKATPRKRKALHDLKKADSAKKKIVEKKEDMKIVDTAFTQIEQKGTIKFSSTLPCKESMLKHRSKVDVKGIKQFYLREDISRILPQKRYATKKGPGYAMQVSVKAAHAKYNFENPTKKVSFGKFAALRNRNVRLLSQSHRDYCCCPYCTNIRFKLLTLSRASSDSKCKKTHEHDVVDILLCPKADSVQFHDVNCINGSFENCSDYVKTLEEFYSQIPEDKTLTWNRWVNDTNPGNGMVKKVVVTEEGGKTSFVQTNNVLKAEILWTMQSITTHNSYKSNENISKLFKLMFPDSQIANRFACGERKTAYLCCFGIAEHVKSILLKEISGYFVVLFDESLNKKSQAKQMDIHVRYWGTNGLVHTRYLGSQFLGHATAEDMLQHFQKGIGDLEKQTKNMLQIPMDGPNVNWKFLDMITTKIEQDFSVSLINIGSCGLHIVHNAFKTGCQATTWDVSSVLSSMYYLFKDSPARKEDYQKSSGSTRMPMKFVTHRWMENVPVVDRAIEVWGNIGQFVKDVEKKKIAKPTCKSFEIVSAALKDKLIRAKFEFFRCVAMHLQAFLGNFQTEKPMVPFLYSELLSIIRGLIVIKPGVLSDTSEVRLLKIDLEDSSFLIEHTKVDIGFSAEKALKETVKENKLSERQVMEFKVQCRSFVLKVLKKLLEKCPATYSLVQHLACLDPRKMSESKTRCKEKLKKVLTYLVAHKRINERDCDECIKEYCDFIDNIPSFGSAKFTEFNPNKDRLDEFYSTFMSGTAYSKVFDVVKMLLTLSHGQASVERGFSVNKEVEMVETDIKKPAQGYSFFQHIFTAKWQNLQFRNIKANIPAGSILQVMDFAKNREIKYQSEIKGAFYTARQVTMHPVVTYFQSDVGLVRHSSIIISEDNCHDFHAVNHFEHVVNSHLRKFIEPKRRIIFSDGCSSQYKSKGPFADIANERTEINRNYFGSEHGKNECDGEIGVLNRALDRAIIGNEVVLNSAEDVYNYCHSRLEVDEVLSTRNFFYVKNGDINRNRPETDVKTVPSTRKFHQVLNSTDENGLLRVRNLSCFCRKCECGDFLNCLNSKYVRTYDVKRLQLNEMPNVNTREYVDSQTVADVNLEANHSCDTSLNLDFTAPESESQDKFESSDNDLHEHSRQGYFERILSKMCQCKSFDDLQILVPAIEEEIKELYGDIHFNPNISVVSHRLTVDRVAHGLDFDQQTIEAAVGKLPVCVQGDGNCLPRSGSILAFGDEDHHTEIRCRIVIEMVTNIHLYLSVEYLQKGAGNLGKEAKHLVHTYSMFTEQYVPEKRLVPRNIYKKEVLETCKNKTYMVLL
ncbi:LOW QUALITY PROTEIN: hypothetical protein MAR_037118 [Mya arenaria]|uniref:Uncharacterized protein n=1 Tax=Mya arenaria TaxID=6604 RepID=A0ABY7FRG6_MYAAR|nr:LOW QUALITY PROTEIN: hypothetical protein MAR_037118 [Mya arenaria]